LQWVLGLSYTPLYGWLCFPVTLECSCLKTKSLQPSTSKVHTKSQHSHRNGASIWYWSLNSASTLWILRSIGRHSVRGNCDTAGNSWPRCSLFTFSIIFSTTVIAQQTLTLESFTQTPLVCCRFVVYNQLTINHTHYRVRVFPRAWAVFRRRVHKVFFLSFHCFWRLVNEKTWR